MIYRNPEHYEDPTAGKALENLEKEGWEYNKARYNALLRESVGMIEKMKRSGTWPTTRKPKASVPQNSAVSGTDERSWRLVWRDN